MDETLFQVAKEFGNMVLNQVNSYLDRVTYVVKEEFGQCGPMNVAINSTLVAACDKIILPWVSTGTFAYSGSRFRATRLQKA